MKDIVLLTVSSYPLKQGPEKATLIDVERRHIDASALLVRAVGGGWRVLQLLPWPS